MFIFNLKVNLRKLFGFDITENPFKKANTAEIERHWWAPRASCLICRGF